MRNLTSIACFTWIAVMPDYTQKSNFRFQCKGVQKQTGAEAPFCFTNHQVNSVNLPKTASLVLVIAKITLTKVGLYVELKSLFNLEK